MNFITRLLPQAAKPYAGRIALTALGFAVAILFLTIGFWRTILIVLLTAIGYVLGKWEDGALDVSRVPIPGRWR